jgi:hypothetical protein
VASRDGVSNVGGSECPEQRHALRRREGEVVAGTSTRLDLDPQGLAIGGPPGEEIAEVLRIDLADQSQVGSRLPDPLTRRLTPAEVVVVDAVGHLVEVVLRTPGRTELPYGEHRGGVGGVVSGRFISAWSESNVTLNVTLADSAWSHGWTGAP